MIFKARLHLKFYIISAVFLCLAVFVWYGIFFLNANEILMEDGAPMGRGLKLLISVLFGAVDVSWTASLLVLIRQMLLGCAFYMDTEGIHHTVTANIFLAFVFIVPVKSIPYSAIERACEEDGVLTVRIDKSKICGVPILKPLVRREYHFFSKFTRETTESIKDALDRFMRT